LSSHRPRKRFGQNFLRDRQVVERILSAADLDAEDRVLEIGPGLGVLTDELLSRAGQVEVMEIDRDLIARLRQLENPKLIIHEGDALRLAWEDLLTQPPYKLVANLPYNISSQILFRVLDHHALFSRLVLMFQKEVGDRLCADPGTGDYGILSVLCRLWFDIERITRVKPGAFHPPPKVDSVVLAFTPLDSPRVEVSDEAFFRKIVKAAFAQRRKTRANALKAAGFEPDRIEKAFIHNQLDARIRGEALSLEQFAGLANSLA